MAIKDLKKILLQVHEPNEFDLVLVTFHIQNITFLK